MNDHVDSFLKKNNIEDAYWGFCRNDNDTKDDLSWIFIENLPEDVIKNLEKTYTVIRKVDGQIVVYVDGAVRKYGINKENVEVCKSMLDDLKGHVNQLEKILGELETRDTISTDEKIWVDLTFIQRGICTFNMYMEDDVPDGFFTMVFPDID